MFLLVVCCYCCNAMLSAVAFSPPGRGATTTTAQRHVARRASFANGRVAAHRRSPSFGAQSPSGRKRDDHGIVLARGNSNRTSALDAGRDGGDGSGIPPPFKVTLEGDDVSYRDAIQRTLGWVGAAVVFGGAMWSVYGSRTGEEFFAGYLVEQSLSIDNLFVFLLLFEYFKVPLQYQDRVLNWGIYGAVVMRAIMIGLGAAAIHNFHAILLVFAAILVYSSGKVLFGGEDDGDDDPGDNSIVKFSRALIKSTDEYDGDRFFTLVEGVRRATPLFICMIAVEISDIVFAVDSIPAVFGVTEVRCSPTVWVSDLFLFFAVQLRHPSI